MHGQVNGHGQVSQPNLAVESPLGTETPTANGASPHPTVMTSSPPQALGITPSQTARIEVIGVGGGGSNAVNRMIASDLQGVGYRVLNTDAQALLQSAAQHRTQLGQICLLYTSDAADDLYTV